MRNLDLVLIGIYILTPILIFLGRNWILNYFKKNLSKDVEVFKHDLEIKKEIVKNDLARSGQRVANLTNNVQILYPDFYEQIKKVQGKVSGLYGASFGISFEGFNDDDLRKYLIEENFPTGKIDEILSNQLRDENFFNNLDVLLRIKSINNARHLHLKSKNFLILKKLFFSKEVSELSFQILNSIFMQIVKIEKAERDVGSYVQLEEDGKKIDNQVNSLEDLMRKELF